jgi:DNA invertase Pin-like site-specific DNA recombinase
MTTAHIYIRFSTLEQREGTSTRRQKDECFSHLTNKGWSLGQVMVDEGRSAFSGDNQAAGAALNIFEQEAALGQHRDSVLLVERLDRLSRQGHEDTFDLIRRFGRHGVHVATVDGSAFYQAGEKLNLADIITMLVKAELALDESVKKSERLKSAYKLRRDDAASTKKPMGKNCPAWLYIEDGAYREDKAKVKLVKDIWKWADQGMGSLTIAKKLNRDGIKPWARWERQAQAWDRARIAKILNDPAVIGEYHPHVMIGGKRTKQGEPIKLFPVIVDPDVFARVRSTAQSRLFTKGGGKSAVVVNLVAGLARCSECGDSMAYKRIKAAGTTYKAKPSGNILTLKHEAGVLVCRSAHHDGPCSNRSQLSYGGLEGALLDAVLPLALDDTAFVRRDEVGKLSRLIAEKTRDADHAKAKAERLWNAFADSGSPMSQKLAQNAEADADVILGEVGELNKQRDRAMGKASSEEHLSRIAELRSHLYDDDLELRAMHRRKVMEGIRSVCDRVVCYPSREVRVHTVESTMMIRIRPGIGRRPPTVSTLSCVHPTREYPNASVVAQALRRRVKEARTARGQ